LYSDYSLPDLDVEARQAVQLMRIDHPYHGYVEFELVGDVVPVSSIRCPEPELCLDLEQAEKVTLLTDHARTQICFNMQRNTSYCILLHTANTAQLMKFTAIEFTSKGVARDYFRYESF